MIDHRAVIGEPPEQRGFTGRPLEPVIADTARIEAFVSVDAGVNRPTEIRSGAWLFKHVHIGHDAIICEDAEVASGAVVGGGAWIGPRVRIGINATILPRQVIGEGARIGAGAVVTKDVPPGAVMVGNPARRLNAESADAQRERILAEIQRATAAGWVDPKSIEPSIALRASK